MTDLKLHTARILIGAPLLASIALLSPVRAHAPAASTCISGASQPTRFDYVVLASLADSPSMLSMSAYGPPTGASAH